MGRSWTIRTRLVVVMLVMSFFSLAGFVILSQIRQNVAMEKNLEVRIEAGLERSDRILTLTLEKYASLLHDLCTDEQLIRMVEEYDQKGMDRVSANILRDYRFIHGRLEGLAALAVFAGDGSCVYSDGLPLPSIESFCQEAEGDRLRGGIECYHPVRCVQTEGGEEIWVFSIQRRLVDIRDADRMVGSVLVCVEEAMLREALEGIDEEFFCLESDGRVMSAPQTAMLGEQIGIREVGRIGEREYPGHRAASVVNEKSGWNIVEFYPLGYFSETMRVQRRVLFLMLAETGVVLLLSILFVTKPVIASVEALLSAMQGVEKGDYSIRMCRQKGMPEEIVKIADGFNAMVERTQQLLLQTQKAAIEQKNAEISALEAQIDPHFLYNTLAAINWKAISHEEYEISEMLGDLADILRYAIKNAGGITSLGRELVWLRKYVRLQQEKLGKEIQVFSDITPRAAGCSMHKLLLQPFVENSIRHGLPGIDRDPLLIITGAVEEGMLCVRIRDNGKGVRPEQITWLNREDYHREDHFGVENVRKRLSLYYGEGAGIKFFSSPGEYMEVLLRIPIGEEEV